MKGQPNTMSGWISYLARTWATYWQTAELSHSTRYRGPGGKASW